MKHIEIYRTAPLPRKYPTNDEKSIMIEIGTVYLRCPDFI